MTPLLLTALTARADHLWSRYCDALPGSAKVRENAQRLSPEQWREAAMYWRDQYDRTMRAVRYLTVERPGRA